MTCDAPGGHGGPGERPILARGVPEAGGRAAGRGTGREPLGSLPVTDRRVVASCGPAFVPTAQPSAPVPLGDTPLHTYRSLGRPVDQ